MKSSLLVIDIDDTIVKADSSVVKIWKKVGNTEIGLTTHEFASDPDSKTHPELFDIREFRVPQKAYQSIVDGEPIVPNLKIVDEMVNAGSDLCFLTARSCETAIKRAIRKFLLIRDLKGNLRKLGNEYKVDLCHAVNDIKRNYPGKTDSEKKGLVLTKLCKKYEKVVFLDDDEKNLESARNLNLPNLIVLKAVKEEL